MSAHTPGPWTLKVHTGDDHQISPEDDWTIEGGGVAICFEGLRNQNADADALLISAAPELLESLVALEKLLSPLAYDSTQKDWLNRARKAIDKATGGAA